MVLVFISMITYEVEHTYMFTNHWDILIFERLKVFGPLNDKDLSKHQNYIYRLTECRYKIFPWEYQLISEKERKERMVYSLGRLFATDQTLF